MSKTSLHYIVATAAAVETQVLRKKGKDRAQKCKISIVVYP